MCVKKVTNTPTIILTYAHSYRKGKKITHIVFITYLCSRFLLRSPDAPELVNYLHRAEIHAGPERVSDWLARNAFKGSKKNLC